MDRSIKRGLREVARLLALVSSAEGRAVWRRERFFRRASQYTPVMAVDDRRGNRYFVTTTDPAIGRGLFLHGEFETGNLDNVLRILAQLDYVPAQVIDVGANVGTASVDLLRHLPDATGIAFEPNAENFSLLRHNLLANGLDDRVTVYDAAVSDEDGSVTLELSPWNPGDHRVRVSSSSGRYDEDRWEVTTVRTWRLDTLVARAEIDPTKHTLLWIDAQGHEAHVLRGARSLRHVPTVVEFWPYGLRRANALDSFLELVRSYARVLEITEHPRSITSDNLARLADELDRSNSYRDLLLLPSTFVTEQ